MSIDGTQRSLTLSGDLDNFTFVKLEFRTTWGPAQTNVYHLIEMLRNRIPVDSTLTTESASAVPMFEADQAWEYVRVGRNSAGTVLYLYGPSTLQSLHSIRYVFGVR